MHLHRIVGILWLPLLINLAPNFMISCLTSSGAGGAYKLSIASLSDEESEISGVGGGDDDDAEFSDNLFGAGDRQVLRRYFPFPVTRQQKRIVPPFVWRQMSMAELDMPCGPAAFRSVKLSTS
ncbi:unnamed protein product [Taenia asiatica]|uniref:Secreted protein n=1 Tax=Taenia asiatica TaxID=60517 RepID=A0A0R3W6C4_TAEAS|nr:unnamed protein product [Taenia asiatica]